MKKQIKLSAPAKVNLALDVIKKRPDGYHEVRMVMQTVKLSDTLTLECNKTKEIQLTTNISYLPTDNNNLVYRAIQLIRETYQITDGISAVLQKKIPIAAGMAGGSTDCAAALIGMNELFDLGLTTAELMEFGITLGADVPYCILQGTALSEGIGEKLTPLPPMVPCHVLIVKPPFHMSTKYVYEHLNLMTITHHPNIDGMLASIHNQDLSEITNYMENILENVTILEYPIIASIKRSMLEHGAVKSLMSGSGPTVFGLFTEYDKIQGAYNWFIQNDPTLKVMITNFCNHA